MCCLPTRRFSRVAAVALAVLAATSVSPTNGEDKRADETGFRAIFDGKTLEGWHISGKTHHGSGGKWFVRDSAIHGTQEKPGDGGILITDEKYGDVEVILEMNNDFGIDSGLFLRSTENGTAYQALIDYCPNGNLMGIYGEGFRRLPSAERLRKMAGSLNFTFVDGPTKIKERESEFPLPVKPKRWPNFWKAGKWNEFRVRIVGNPPEVTTWINGVKFLQWKDTERRLPDTGGIALQIHGGGSAYHYLNKFVRYRKIRVKELD